MREIKIEGNYVDARRVGSHLFMVSNAQLDIAYLLSVDNNTDISNLLPLLNDRRYAGGVDDESTGRLY